MCVYKVTKLKLDATDLTITKGIKLNSITPLPTIREVTQTSSILTNTKAIYMANSYKTVITSCWPIPTY